MKEIFPDRFEMKGLAEFAVFFAFFVPFVLLALCFAPSPSEAARYDNGRFGFSVDVSDPEFVMLPPSANGDGIAFQSSVNPDVSILFFGRNQLGETDTIEEEAKQQTPDDGEDVFFTQNRRDFHLQYDHDGLRTETLVFLVDGVFYTGMSVAPVALRELYNPKFHGIFVTWKIRGNPTVY
jgi:hypothetical protein